MNPLFHFRRLFTAMGLTVLLGANGLASTFVVDAAGAPGTDYTDLPEAIVAAQAGDVLLVLPGSYSPFTCNEGIAILGYGVPVVSGTARFDTVPRGQLAILAGFSAGKLEIAGCDGRVVIQQIAEVDSVSVELSLDVRLLGVDVTGGVAWGQTGVRIVASRVEIVQSTVHGGPQNVQGVCADQGGSGLEVLASSFVHFASSEARGADGPICFQSAQPAGDGGHGVHVEDSELVVAGGGSGRIRGGDGGVNYSHDNCWYDGRGGNGIDSEASEVAYSRTSIRGGVYSWSPSVGAPFCDPGVELALRGSSFTNVDPQHATLVMQGVPTPGDYVHLALRGPTGSQARVWIGRKLTLESEAGADVDLAVDRVRLIELGAIPENGSVPFAFEVPATYPPGTLLAMQAECRLRSGRIRRSNSVPMVVR